MILRENLIRFLFFLRLVLKGVGCFIMSVNKKNKATRRATSILIILIIVIMCLIMLYCLSQLIPKFLEYRASDDAYSDLSVGVVKEYDSDGVLKIIENNKAAGKKTTKAKSKKKSESSAKKVKDAIQIDWDAFAGTEIIAWFQMDDISYPIMQHSDNEYYLHHLPDGTYNGGGSLFLLSYNNPLLTDQSSFVYGHNMNNGSMFGKLKHYTGKDSEDHKFYIYLPDGTRHEYQFFSVATVLQESKTYTWSFASDESFLDWQEWMLGESMIGTSLEKSVDAKFVTLSTCNGYSGTNHRLVVCGQETEVLELQEPASWYEEYMAKYNHKMTERQERADRIANKLASAQKKRRESLYKIYRDSDGS